MTGHGAEFGRKKEEAIAALLNHRTIDEAAAAAKISAKTLLRWMKEPEFDTAYRAAKRAALLSRWRSCSKQRLQRSRRC